jgi:signal peptidase II
MNLARRSSSFPMAEPPAASSVPPPAPRRGPSTFRLRLAIVLLTLSLFGCDHATKVAAHANLSHGEAISVVAGILELRFAANDDTAFSLLRTFGIARTPSLLLAASALALVGVVAVWVASRRRASRAQHVGFALVLAGALGNVVDRAMRGYVVDFIHLTRWPIFNVADVAVVLGVAVLGCAALAPRGEPGASPPPAPDGPP